MGSPINKILASTAQSFTTAEQAQARANIGAVAQSDLGDTVVVVNWDGSADIYAQLNTLIQAKKVPVLWCNNYHWWPTNFDDDGRFVFQTCYGEQGVFAWAQIYKNFPENNGISVTPCKQIQADWDQTSSAYGDYIKNKPTIANVPAVTSADDNKVLTADYTGGVGSYSWETAPSSGLPSYTANEASKSLVVNGDGDGVEWDQRVRGILTEDDGQGGVTSRDIKTLRINTNTGDAGLVRVTPVGGSVQIIGYLAPDFAMVGDEGKLLRINSDATGIEWANPPFVKHDPLRMSSWAFMNPYTEEYSIFGGAMTFKMEWAANDHGLGPSAMTPFLKGKVITASGWTANIHVSKGASGNMTYQETSIVHGTSDNTYVDLSQCDYGNGFAVAADTYPMIVNMDIQYITGPGGYQIGHLTWMKTNNWVFLRTTYDG